MGDTDLHKLFIIYLNPSISVSVDAVTKIVLVSNEQLGEGEWQINPLLESFRQSLYHNTSPHKPIKRDTGWWTITIRYGPRGYNGEDKYPRPKLRNARQSPRSPYFCSTSDSSCGERLYPKLLRAEANSCPSIEPE